MKYYLKCVLIGVVAILTFNLIRDFSFSTIGNFFYAIYFCCLPSVLCCLIVNISPKSIILYKNPFLKVLPCEKKILEFLGVKTWKNKVPDAGAKIDNFSKSKLAEPRNKEYIDRFIYESLRAETIHSLSIIWGIVSLFFIKKDVLIIAIPVVVLNTYLHGLPALIQRYVRPRLIRISERLEKTRSLEETTLDESLDDDKKYI